MAARTASVGDTISGLVLAALGVFIVGQALSWEIVGLDGPGPGFFPLGYGIAILVLSLALAVSPFLRKAAPEVSATSETADGGGLPAALLTWAGFTASIAAMPLLGFFISLAVMTFLMVLLVFRQPAHKALLTAVGCGLGFYLVFPLALGIALPVGRLGF